MHKTNSVNCFYKGMLVIGSLMLFVGIADLGLGIANAVICGFMGAIGYGIWGSVLCFIAAITGIVASQYRTRSCIITHLIFAILAALSATIQIAMSINSGVVDYYPKTNRFYNSVTPSDSAGAYYYFYNFGCSNKQRSSYPTHAEGPTVTDALLASFAIMQGILALVTATFSCRTAFCPPGVETMPWEGSQTQLVKI